MTSPVGWGHWDFSRKNSRLRNQKIRAHFIEHNRWLPDFEDIECYEPHCYRDSNWTIEWQNRHIIDADYYGSSDLEYHKHTININMKAYAAWCSFFEIAEFLESFQE